MRDYGNGQVWTAVGADASGMQHVSGRIYGMRRQGLRQGLSSSGCRIGGKLFWHGMTVEKKVAVASSCEGLRAIRGCGVCSLAILAFNVQDRSWTQACGCSSRFKLMFVQTN